MTDLPDRIRELMTTNKWTVKRISDISGVSPSAVYQWLGSGSKRIHSIGNIDALTRLQKASGYSAAWLANGSGPKFAASQVNEPSPEYPGRARRAKSVPVVGTAKMGNDGFYEEISSITGTGDGHIEIQTDDPNAYGLRVRGMSMFPAIRDGWYVLVEPNCTPCEGEYALLNLNDGRKMIKELMYRRPGTVEVMSVNGGERMSIELQDLQDMQPVGAVVSPSKWRPD